MEIQREEESMADENGTREGSKRESPSKRVGREHVPRIVRGDEQGRVMSRYMRRVIEQQVARFREKFGREPREHDPVFFDPEADEPRPSNENAVEEMIATAAHKAGIPEAQIYAMRKTGMIVVLGVNDHLFTEEDLVAWLAAVQEYDSVV